MRLLLALLCVALVGCAPRPDRDSEYVHALHEVRKANDFDRQVLVAKCGGVVDLWQTALAQDAAAGVLVSEQAEKLRNSPNWGVFHERRREQDDAIRRLMDPPPQYQSQYGKVLRQHGYIARLLALLERPTGSVVSYATEVRALASEYDQLKAELDVSLPLVGPSPAADNSKR